MVYDIYFIAMLPSSISMSTLDRTRTSHGTVAHTPKYEAAPILTESGAGMCNSKATLFRDSHLSLGKASAYGNVVGKSWAVLVFNTILEICCSLPVATPKVNKAYHGCR